MTALFLTQRRRGAEGVEILSDASHARSAQKNAVILNGVSPRAQAGTKRSEEPSPRDAYGTAGQSLTETRAEAAGVMARVHSHRLRPFQSAILHSVPVAKPPGTPFRMTAFFSTLRSAATNARTTRSLSAPSAPLRLCVFKNPRA